jgi:hypothetical protein
MTRESVIEKYLVQQVKALGGEVRKVKWIGRRGAPDRIVMLPRRTKSVKAADVRAYRDAFEVSMDEAKRELTGLPRPATTIWVELKTTGVAPEDHQLREHERMRKMGQRVVVVDSLEGVDEVLR